MEAIKVGATGIYHSEHGDVPCTVIEYDEGKPGGDYRIAGFWNTKGKEAGQGDVFNVYSVVGEEQGAFSVA